jgi:hypothetical protein
MIQQQVTIAIATWNSANVIIETLESIKNQCLPSHIDLSVLAIDGGSSDQTYAVCEEAGAHMLHNPNGDPVSAKLLALAAATGTHIMYLDHDERLISKFAIANTMKMFADYPDLKIVWQSGYDVDSIGGTANLFTSEFGDPYSKFIYGNSAMADRRICDVSGAFSKSQKATFGTLFLASDRLRPVILEIAAAGTVADVEFLKSIYENHGPRSLVTPLSFMKEEMIAVASSSNISHQSSPTWSTVRTKVRWRVSNAVDPKSHLHPVSGRHGHSATTRHLRLWNALFIVYCLTVLPALIDYSYYAIRRKRPKLLWAAHLPFYVTSQIVVQYAKLKVLRRQYEKNYAGK